ncbi:hypothetical protein RHS01_02243 [Rhizoctonia solani]|uniref:Uncharacterized protein n=1 Tax=Rhizoctonia solani TaxID=456999 RepID=A0A8H7IIG0_9AGAM|nr:hypothetical protein RHS01_02243 [Rhizoctonia solani]
MLRPPFPRFFYNTQTTPTTNEPSLNNNTYVFVQPAPSTNALGLERSNSPHSVDGSTAIRTRNQNRKRRGTENSLPVTLDALEVHADLRKESDKEQEPAPDKQQSEPVKDLPAPVSEPTTPTVAVTPVRKEPKTPAQPKMEPAPDYQVPFPQVQDPTSRAKRSGDWERDQAALRSPTLSAHSNTSGSHTTAPTSASTANTSAGALTIPGAYDSGSASGGSGLETTPTRETVAKAKRGSAGRASTRSNNCATFASKPIPDPPTVPRDASPPSTGSPQIQSIRPAQGGSSPSQPPRQAYAPPPPPPAMGSGSTSSSMIVLRRPRSRLRAHILTRPPYVPQLIGAGPTAPTLSTVVNLIQAQPVPISPVHPRPQHRTPASVLGPTKMQESWTAAVPLDDPIDEMPDRNHLRSPRDGAAALRGHRGTGGGSIDFKEKPYCCMGTAAAAATAATTTRKAGVPQSHPQPPMTRNATMPITTRYETLSPPPIHQQHGGLHLDLHDNQAKAVPEKPQPAPAPPRIQTGRGPSPSPNLRGRQPAPPAPAPAANTPPYSYDDPYRSRSGSHASSFAQQQQQPPRAPPPVNNLSGVRAHPELVLFRLTKISTTMNTSTSLFRPCTSNSARWTKPLWTGRITLRASTHFLIRINLLPGHQAQVQPPPMDPATAFQQQHQPQPQQQHRSPEVNGRAGGRSPLPAPSAGHGSGSGSSEAEDLKTPRSPSVPLPGDGGGYGQRGFGGYSNFSVGPPTVNHIHTQDMGYPNGQGQMYPSMGFAQSQYALQQMGAGHQGMGMHQMNGRQMNGRDPHHQQYNYGYPQDLSSSASGSFLDGWNQYPNHIRPSAPVPPTPSTGSGPSVVSGDIRNGQPGHMTRAQTVMYKPSSAAGVSTTPTTTPNNMLWIRTVPRRFTQSSPSHQPVGLPYGGKRFGGPRMGTKGSRRRRMMEEYRPESTAETEFETETEMEEVWLEESDDDELENEFHPTYFVNPAKRKRRFEQKWEQMVKLFREIDRETDATMILAAAPPDQHQTHLLLSRSILRDTNFSHIAQEARSVFSDITVARRHQRSETLRRARQERQRKKASDERLSAVAHLTLATQGGADNVGSGSDETSVPTQQTDQDLRMALDAARVSLQEMRRVYDEMETRHREESNRRKEESLTLEKLLTSILSSKAVQPSSS